MPRRLRSRPKALPRAIDVTQIERLIPDVGTLHQRLKAVKYHGDMGLVTAMFCALRLRQPLLLEGEPGVGKTEAAKALSKVLSTELVRLQCYEGIDLANAAYEWNYTKQLLSIRLSEAEERKTTESDLFEERFLSERPLLRALRYDGPLPAVLLLDEIDRADDEFEAFLLETLGEFAITIPELGTFTSANPPIVILTSNRTRDLHDALKRRCLYHFIDYPTQEVAESILRERVPNASTTLLHQVAVAVARVRDLPGLQKAPGLAETINWVQALELLGVSDLTNDVTPPMVDALLKFQDDQQTFHVAWPHLALGSPPS